MMTGSGANGQPKALIEILAPFRTPHGNNDGARFLTGCRHLDHVADRSGLASVGEGEGVGDCVDNMVQEVVGIRGGVSFEPWCYREVEGSPGCRAGHPGRVVDGDSEVGLVKELLECLTVLSAESEVRPGDLYTADRCLRREVDPFAEEGHAELGA
jgi:hypothetical protein